jgi:hypothetical protein
MRKKFKIKNYAEGIPSGKMQKATSDWSSFFVAAIIPALKIKVSTLEIGSKANLALQ